MWPNHVIYNEYLWTLVPSARRQLVTIVRLPAERWLASYTYYTFARKHARGLSAEKLVLQASDSPTVRERWLAPHERSEIAFNSHSYELGGRARAEREIRSGNWLALVNERLDESLVLFGAAYGWNTSDLLYAPMKVGSEHSRARRRLAHANISEAAYARLVALTADDHALYATAIAVHEARARAFGSSFDGAVQALRRANAAARDMCADASRATAEPQCIEMATDNDEWLRRTHAWQATHADEAYPRPEANAKAAAAEGAPTSAPTRPDIMFVLADDLGAYDVSYAGASLYDTPHIDSLARDPSTVMFVNSCRRDALHIHTPRVCAPPVAPFRRRARESQLRSEPRVPLHGPA